jgi:signal transduction histidine kinase
MKSMVVHSIFSYCKYLIFFACLQYNSVVGQSTGWFDACIELEEIYESPSGFVGKVEKSERDAFFERYLNCIENLEKPHQKLFWYREFLNHQNNSISGNFESVLALEAEINQIAPYVNDARLKSSLFNELGISFLRYGSSARALIYLQIALGISKEKGLDDLVYPNLVDLAFVSFESYDFEGCQTYLNEAEENRSSAKESQLDILDLEKDILTAGVEYKLGKPDSSLFFLDKAYYALKKLDIPADRNDFLFSWMYHQMFMGYLYLNDVSKAQELQNKFSYLAKFSQYSLIHQVFLLLKTGEFQQAKELLDQHDDFFVGENAWLLKEYHKSTGDVESEVKVLQDKIDYYQKLVENRNNEFAQFSQEQYNLTEKDKALTELANSEDRLKLTTLVYTVIALICLGLGWILFRIIRNLKSKNRELLRLNIETQSQAEDIEKANQDMENFIHALSHDAISYIDMIINFSNPELYEEKTIKLQSGEQITRYARQLKALSLNLINQHLLEKEFVNEPVNLEILVQEIREEFGYYLRESNLTVELEKVWVLGDALKLKQVFINLILNAVRFKKPLEPHHLAIRSALKDSDPAIVIISVADNGIGIPEENHDKIFEKFFTSGSGKGGTGLGLFICKEIVQKMGGRIWLSSKNNEGCTFFIELKTKSPIA